MSPETISLYPDRPIRPLPKRRLRERLSPDVADSIQYPPTSQGSTSLFYHPYNIRGDAGASGAHQSQHLIAVERGDENEQRNYISRRNNGEELDSEEGESGYRSRQFVRHIGDAASRSYRYVQKPDSKHSKTHLPGSNASSVDGYDSFENTNNKKKRKIPTPGDSTLNGVHLSSEMANLGLSGPEDLIEEFANGSAAHHIAGIAGSGVSGPGRGRYGRMRSARSPLRTLSDSSNWSNSRTSKQRQPQWSPQKESPGIISSAIANANANAEKPPIPQAREQENFSLLQQQAARKSNPASTQFTFTCDSQIPGTIPWPGSPMTSATNHSVAAKGSTTHGAQTNPGMAANLSANPASAQSRQAYAPSQYAQNQAKQGGTSAPAPKKHRRRTGKEYLIAARERRQQQEYRNFHHPPSPEDAWICEFCEYERIFGTPPEALIKQYELKDRRLRKQEAERRRLLEKAKMKGRKGRKGSKAAPKSSTAPQDRQAHTQPAPPPAPPHHSQSKSQDTQSEEYYEDEYDDESAHGETLPLSPNVPLPASPEAMNEARNRAREKETGMPRHLTKT